MKNIATTVMLLMFAYGLTGCKNPEQQTADDAAAMADAAGAGDSTSDSSSSGEFDASKEFSSGNEDTAVENSTTTESTAEEPKEVEQADSAYVTADQDKFVFVRIKTPSGWIMRMTDSEMSKVCYREIGDYASNSQPWNCVQR